MIKAPPPTHTLLLFQLFFPSVPGIGLREWGVGTVNIKWMIGDVTEEPDGLRLPDVLVHRHQQQDLSPGSARVCGGLQS